MRIPLLVLLLTASLVLAGCAGEHEESKDLAQDDGPSGGNGNDGDEVGPNGGGASAEEIEDVTGEDPARY